MDVTSSELMSVLDLSPPTLGGIAILLLLVALLAARNRSLRMRAEMQRRQSEEARHRGAQPFERVGLRRLGGS